VGDDYIHCRQKLQVALIDQTGGEEAIEAIRRTRTEVTGWGNQAMGWFR
jgi:hypothetical protein